MIELERTFLVRSLPRGWRRLPGLEIYDRYFPVSSIHPDIRLRQKGQELTLTKKHPIRPGDASRQEEQTISLSSADFQVFKKIPALILSKTRHRYRWRGHTIEFDVFRGPLAGLVLADVEFATRRKLRDFIPPDFFLADVTQEEIIAGGKLAGKKYRDLKKFLRKYNYRRIRT